MGLKTAIYSRQSLSGSFKYSRNRRSCIWAFGLHPKVNDSRKSLHVPWLGNMLISEGSKGNTRILRDCLALCLLFESCPLTHLRLSAKGNSPRRTKERSHIWRFRSSSKPPGLEATNHLVSEGWQQIEAAPTASSWILGGATCQTKEIHQHM